MAPLYTKGFQKSLDFVLKIDPSLQSIVDTHVFPAFIHPRPENQSSFQYLVRNILSQQVSGAAGNAILKRFLELTSVKQNEFPTPERLLKFTVEELRGAGLSMRKAEYVRGLSQAYIDNDLSDEILQNADDDEVVDKIVSIRGLGPWTAQMFLIFYLHRSDVYSPADVGVQRGFRRYIKDRPHLLKDIVDHPAAPSSPGKSKKARAKISLPDDLKDMERIVAKFAPHRSAFQMILWKISDIKMNTVEARDEEAQSLRNNQLLPKPEDLIVPVLDIDSNSEVPKEETLSTKTKPRQRKLNGEDSTLKSRKRRRIAT